MIKFIFKLAILVVVIWLLSTHWNEVDAFCRGGISWLSHFAAIITAGPKG